MSIPLVPWYIALLGEFKAVQNQRALSRFRTQKTGALLAYLAFYQDRLHPRDMLADLLWPEDDQDSSRASLRTALNSLRKQLEPPDAAPQSVLIADRFHVQLRSEAVTTDVCLFQRSIQEARRQVLPQQKAAHLARAVQLYAGELLPGFYDDWVVTERLLLEDAYADALRHLVTHLEEAGDLTQALDYATRIVAMDPIAEEAHVEVIRLYRKAGRPREALRQYDTLERVLQSQLSAEPAHESRALAETIRETLTRPVGVRRSHRSVPTPALARTEPLVQRREALTSSSPLPLSPLLFFGRDADIKTLTELLERNSRSRFSRQPSFAAPVRLLTLLGPGGSGKTRLAIEVARKLEREFAGAVWFVKFADLSEPQAIPDAILEAMNLTQRARGPWYATIQTARLDRGGLLILDNFEHLVAEGARYIQDLLTHLPGLICLTTSRLKLGLEGERTFLVAPLSVPEREHVLPETLHQYPAVQLFVDRAQAVRSDFQITARNAPAIQELCRRLDGLPLAIELAAAWAQTLTPAQMLERLKHRFQMLVSRHRDQTPRHRSLYAAIASSYALLPPEARRLFCQLSVFRGGFTLEAAQEVCRLVEPEESNAASCESLLMLLLEHSLVRAEEAEEAMRFVLLESLREFAWEQLNAEERFALANTHAVWCRRWAHEAHDSDRKDRARWVPVLSREQANWHAALEFCFHTSSLDSRQEIADSDRDPARLGMQLTIDLNWYWQWRGTFDEGRRWLEQALAYAQDNRFDQDAEQVRYFLAGNAHFQGDHRAAETYCLESLRRWQDDWRPGLKVDILSVLGQSYGSQHDYVKAESTLLEGLALLKRSGEWKLLGGYLGALGVVAKNRGDLAQARLYMEEALDADRANQDLHGLARALNNLGNVATDQEDYRAAGTYLRESLALKRVSGDRPGIANTLSNLCIIASEENDLEQAFAFMGESLALRIEMQDRAGQAISLGVLAGLMAKRDPLRAVRFYAAVQTLFEQYRLTPPPAIRRKIDDFLEKARLEEPAFEITWNMGRLLSPDAAVEEALQFCTTFFV